MTVTPGKKLVGLHSERGVGRTQPQRTMMGEEKLDLIFRRKILEEEEEKRPVLGKRKRDLCR